MGVHVNRISSRVVWLFVGFTVSSLLAACGGGGSGTSNGSGTPPVIAAASPTLVLSGSTNSVTATSPSVLTASLKDSSGLPLSGAVVTFKTGGTGFGVFFPTGGTALTNSVGTATILLNAGMQLGADSITASATVGRATILSTPFGYAVSAISTPVPAASIAFTSATPNTIAIQGAGGQETSVVRFTVHDASGGPAANQAVSFRLESPVGGVLLGPVTATSAADGTVSTGVSSGTVATPVRVRATLISNAAVTTVSSQLVVSTAIPHKRGFGMTFTPKPVVNGFYGGTVSVLLADRNGNLVPDGTAVSFRTQQGLGAVGPSCLTVSGACSVQFSIVNTSGTLVQILATAIGEDSFTDVNANGKFDAGEPTDTLSEAFIDSNHNGVYNFGEEFVDANGNGIWDPAPPSPTFRGVLRTDGVPPSTIIVWRVVDVSVP